MGKRKSSAKAAPKKKSEPLSTTFKCLFCHHEKAVSVKLDKTTMFGHLNCKTCGQRYASPINNLSAAVDVYYDWVDACEEIRLKQPVKERPAKQPNPLDHGYAGGARMTMQSDEADPNRNPDEDLAGEEDAIGEEDEEDDIDRERERAGRRTDKTGTGAAAEILGDDDSDDDDDDVNERDRAKRRRVRDYDDDDDDEDDE